MNDYPRKVLKKLLKEQGIDLYKDHSRIVAFLNDICGDYRKEVSLLISVLEEGIPEKLLRQSRSSNRKYKLVRFIKRICGSIPLEQEPARWAVESWALALGVIKDAKSIKNKNHKARHNYLYILLLSLVISAIIVIFSAIFPPFTKVMRICKEHSSAIFAVPLLITFTFLVLGGIEYIERKLR